jgi:hypothetical protein
MGQSALNHEHRNVFDRYSSLLSNPDLTTLLGFVDDQSTASVTGVLHNTAGARNRIIHRPPASRPFDPEQPLSGDLLEKELQLGLVLTNKSRAGALRDAYSPKLFAINNMFKLFEAAHFRQGYCPVIWALILTASIGVPLSL